MVLVLKPTYRRGTLVKSLRRIFRQRSDGTYILIPSGTEGRVLDRKGSREVFGWQELPTPLVKVRFAFEKGTLDEWVSVSSVVALGDQLRV